LSDKPSILITVSDRSIAIRIDIDCLGASVIIASSESLSRVPPIVEKGLIVPGHVKSR
jgi:hypothetical protein